MASPRSVLALALVAIPLAAQTVHKPTLDEALQQARTPIYLVDGKFSGAGADVFTQAVAQSKFVLLGEDHLTREIPEFASALCDAMHPDAYAVEAGPEAAGFVNGLLKSPDRIARMAARSKAHANNMAFLDVREENDLAAHCAAAFILCAISTRAITTGSILMPRSSRPADRSFAKPALPERTRI